MSVWRVLVVGLICLAPAAAFAQAAPGWSRGQQLLAIGYEECIGRAPKALAAEGFSVEHAAGNFAVGRKAVHTAVIICNPADGKMVVNIVVASNGEGGGNERQRLQARMEGTSAPPPPPPPPPAGVAVTWDLETVTPAGPSSPGGNSASYTWTARRR